MTLILWSLTGATPVAAQTLSPEAREILDRLDDRIAAARAGQASRDAFLAALESAGDGCGEWGRDRAMRRDPDLREVLEEVCPQEDPAARKPRPEAGSRRSYPRARLAAAQAVRPAGEGAADPALSAALEGPGVGLEAAAVGMSLGRRRAWVRGGAGPGEETPAWTLQAGHLGFRDLEPAREEAPGSPLPLPRLDFLSGRSSLPGGRFRSGLGGPLGSASSPLDGAGLSAAGGAWKTGAWASWNRREPASEETRRQDAALAAAAGSLAAGPFTVQAQAATLRLETAGKDPVRIHLAGAALGPATGGLRLAGAASMLDAPDSTGGPAAGAYAELHLSGASHDQEKPSRYLLEIRQASPGWAAPLSAAPALSRDTLDDGWILPGRGEGGIRARSILPLRTDGIGGGTGGGTESGTHGRTGGWEAFLLAAGDAGWNADGPLAGEGRLEARLGWGSWTLQAGQGLRWRRTDLGGSGAFKAASATLLWRQGAWRARATGVRRQDGGGDTWPLELECARRGPGREAGSWSVEGRSGDALHPGRDWRLGLRQAWRQSRGMTWSHALRLPGEGLRIGPDLGYQVRLEISSSR